MGVMKFGTPEQKCFETTTNAENTNNVTSVTGKQRNEKYLIIRKETTMIRNVATCAKSLLFLLNIWVLCVVLVVVLGKWQIFETKDMSQPYDASHLVVMRELKEEDQLFVQPSQAKQLPVKAVTPIKASLNVHKSVVNFKQPQKDIKKPAAKVDFSSREREDRVETLKHWCRKLRPNQPDPSLIPAVQLQQILVDDKRKLLYCQIPGVAQNDIRKILVFLSGATKVKNHLDISVTDVFTKYGKNLTKLSDFSASERKKRIQTYYKMAFVREPLERLYSTYENKMRAKWSTYFHMNFGKKIIKKYRRKPSKTSLQKGNDVTFAEFIQYVVDAEFGDEVLNEHWQQYYRQCHPCLINYNFIGKYESLNKDIDHVLKSIHVRDKFHSDLVSTNYTYPKQTLTKAYQTVPISNLRKLWKIYYPDYNLFSYPFPDVLRSSVKSKEFNDY